MLRRSSDSVRVFYPKLARTDVIRLLSERLKELDKELPLVRVVLFGSYAKGNYTVGSDIDLVVIHRGEKRVDTYALVKQILDLPRLEPHVYSELEYEQMEGTVRRMAEGGITLFGGGGQCRA
jgi:predicted nucleotidyltransferase